MRLGKLTIISGILSGVLVSPSLAQQTERARPERARTDADVTVQRQGERGQPARVRVEVRSDDDQEVANGARAQRSRISQLSDFHLASWIVLENDVQLQMSRLAAEKADTPAVKQYAQRMVQSHSQLVNRLQVPLKQFSKPAAGAEFDFAAVLQEVARRLESSDQRQQRGYRPRPVLDGVRDRLEERQLDEEREDVEQQREDLRDARREREIIDRDRDEAREERGDRERVDDREREREGLLNRDRRREDGLFERDRDDRRVAQEREELQDEIQDRRAERRDEGRFDGELRTAVRQNLPEILAVIEEAVEAGDGEAGGLAFIQLKRELSEQYARSVIEEIQRQPEGDFDQAYLGFEVANHLRMIDTMQVAKRHASPQLAQTLDSSIGTMQQHLEKARQLMREIGTHRDRPQDSERATRSPRE